jgi:hypothetical protein
MWHLPDGPQQQQRDQFLGSKPLGAASQWDGKNVDDPPEGKFNPLTFPYMSGFDVVDHVSFPPSKRSATIQTPTDAADTDQEATRGDFGSNMMKKHFKLRGITQN